MIRDNYHVGSLTPSPSFTTVSSFSQFAFDLEGNIEMDNSVFCQYLAADGSLDTLEHLLGDPFDYMYDIVWESNF